MSGGVSYAREFGPSFDAPGKFAISKPSKGLRTTSMRTSSFGVQQEWCATAFPSTWEVKGKELDLVPINFPLERTHREISEDASIVAKRISDTLREHSIETEFDNAKAKAKCTTQDCVNFRIRLYAGGEEGVPVVVEVQRRCGSAFSFMRTCRAILDGAEGKITTQALDRSKIIPTCVADSVSKMNCIKGIIVDENLHQLHSRVALDETLEMIRSSRRDLNLLGLENLCSLTDPIKTSPRVSLFVSKEVIIGNDTSDIREELRVLTERDVFVPQFEQYDGPPSQSAHLRQLALQVFSNALSLCGTDGCLRTSVSEHGWFADQLIPSLVEEVRRASLSSNCAYEAACSLNILISCSKTALKIVIDNGGISALESAHEFGLQRHELLADETLRCLEVMKNSSVSL
jgi:hypothetical protein